MLGLRPSFLLFLLQYLMTFDKLLKTPDNRFYLELSDHSTETGNCEAFICSIHVPLCRAITLFSSHTFLGWVVLLM